MSRFERLIKNAQSKPSAADKLTPTVTTSGRFGSAAVQITTQGPFTQSDYMCIQVPCSGCEDAPILNIIEPDYNLEVGIESSIPIELVFTELEGTVEERELDMWSRHALATKESYVFKCPECSHENVFVICKDSGLLILTVQQKHTEIPVPKNRIRFLNTPKCDWNLEN